jgi:hypothetical protein
MVSQQVPQGKYFPGNPEAVPQELRAAKKWICWRFEDRNGRETKVPCRPGDGREVSVQDSPAWVAFDFAMRQARVRNDVDGIGWVFADGGGVVGIDLDDCLQPDGSLSEFARGVLQRFPRTYCEISPSGTGVKMWLKGALPIQPAKTGRKIPRLGVEVYCRGRYFTLTGNRLIDAASGRNEADPPELVDFSEELERWFRELFPSEQAAGQASAIRAEGVPAEVAEIVAKASAARNGDSFRRLWSGDLSEHADDHSAADQALANMLAFWCGNDARRVDEVFRASGLMRPKWETRQDYRTATIRKAIAACLEPFDWSRKPKVQQSRPSQLQQPQAGQRDGEQAVVPAPWPELVPLAAADPPEIEPDDFPAPFNDIVRVVAESGETPAAMAGLTLLGILAVAAQRKFQVRSDGQHCEALSLYCLTAMAPGERKSSILRILRQPLTAWETARREELTPLIRERAAERKAAEARIAVLQTKAAKVDDSTQRQDLVREIVALQNELPEVPAFPMLTMSDVTLEALAVEMSRQDERMGVVADEGGIFEILAGLYSRGVPKLDLALQGFDGGEVRVVRSGKDAITLLRPSLSMVLTVQPSVLQEVSENKAFRGRGLIQRFIFAVPKGRLGYRQLPENPMAVPERLSQMWQRVVSGLLNQEQQRDDAGQPVARTITLEPAAATVWKAFQREMEPTMQPGGRWAFETGWASKFPGAVARIAAVMHGGLCSGRGVEPDSMPISAELMQKAVSLAGKLEKHALAAFSLAGLNDDEKLALKIARWLQARGEQIVTLHEILRGPCTGVGRQEMDGALKLLTQCGWIRNAGKRQPHGGGRPSEQIEVNPAIARAADKTDKTPSEGVEVRVSSVSSVGFAESQPWPDPEQVSRTGDGRTVATEGSGGEGAEDEYSWVDNSFPF